MASVHQVWVSLFEVNTSFLFHILLGTVPHLSPSWELNCLTFLNSKRKKLLAEMCFMVVLWVKNGTNYAKRMPLQICYGNTVMLI